MKPFLFSIALFIGFVNSYANVPDTLTKAEITQIEAGFKKSTFYAFYMADSFSRKRDTAHCGEWFLKIDPYYFLTGFSNAGHADSFLHKYRLSESVKTIYREQYQKVLATPRTKEYLLMKQLRDEDQDIRRKLENCGDSFTCSMLNKKMRFTDSVHFETLYKYVQEKGWPNIADGSVYAALIAIHDGNRADYYVPIIKQAIIDGKLPMEPLQLIFTKRSARYTSYDHLRKRIDTSIKYSFVVNQLMGHRIPVNVERIKNVIKKHCPNVDLLLVYEQAYKFDNYLAWVDKEHNMGKNKDGSPVEQFFDELATVCPKRFTKGIWSVHCLPTERKFDRLIFYVILKKPAK